ncbi:MAG: site-specific tyrosine recombinase XerD [Bacteroidia bacterium]
MQRNQAIANATLISEFASYLQLERSLSENTISSYLSDIQKLESYLDQKSVLSFTNKEAVDFVVGMEEVGLSKRSVARIISALKTLYKFLIAENYTETSPLALIETPKLPKNLPEVLSHEEVVLMISQLDLSSSGGERDKTCMLLLYSCGLRVSELINLKINDIHFDDGFIKVLGKGNKERLVPIGNQTLDQVKRYLSWRNELSKVSKDAEGVLILNQRGGKLSRTSLFKLVKELASRAQIEKNVSPHTLRHSFATVLIEAGADLRAVQQMLGHESITTTEIYTHLDRSYLKSVVEQYHPRS